MKSMIILFLAFLLAGAESGAVKNPYYKEIPNKKFELNKITYIPLSGAMRNPNSAWGSIGTAREGFVYIMVCDHMSDAEVFEYNTKTDKLFTLGRITDHLGLKSWAERSPKIHSQVYQHAKSGLIYFGTDAGERSEGDLYDHQDEGYWGGFLCSLNPVTKEIKNLGLAGRHAGVKCLIVDSDNDVIYMNLSDGSRFTKYDIKTGKFTDLGRINGYEIPRTLFFDKWNNAYNCTESSELVRYNRTKDELEFLNVRLPGEPMGPSQIAYGPNRDYMYGIDNYSAIIFKYTPQADGPGRIDSLFRLNDAKKGVGTRNLNFAGNKLYAVLTGMESDEAAGDSIRGANLVVFDPEKRVVEKKVRMDDCISACYGHPNMDAQGNCYVAGFMDVQASKKYEGKKALVHLVKFNPKSL